MEQWFIRSMSWTCRHCVFVIALCAAVCAVLGAIAIPHLSLGAFPISDKGEISVTLEFPVNYSLQKTYEETDAILKEISKREDVVSAAATAGYVNAMFGQVPEGVYLTEANLKLIPKDKRKSVSAAAGELREMLAKKENLRCAVNIPLSTGTTEAEMIAYFTGPDYDELCRLGEKALSELRKSGMACDIDSSIRQNKPRVNIVPNRAVLRNLGIPENVLGTAVACFFDGVTAGTYKVGTRNYDIRLKTNEEEGFANAGNIVIGNLNGNPVNIDVLADFEESPVKITMIRQDKERSVWIYCNAVPGVTLGNLMSLMNEKCGKDLPAGYRLNFGGQASTMQDGARDFAEVFIAAVVLLYLLLAALLESWKLPFLIMFTVLPGFIGMFFAVYLSGEAMSMVALLGGVMMIGIVVNNAILFMDETRVLVNSGVPPHDAMIQAAGNKLRPVLITSLTSIIGMLPMAFGNGVGSELRTNCGLGVAGGLTLSTFMTVYLIPALYFLFTKKKNRQMKEKMS